MAFYKNNNGVMMSAQVSVVSPDFSIFAVDKDVKNRNVDGWQWFNSEDAAYAAYGIKKLEVDVFQDIKEMRIIRDDLRA